jgi:hypothetical protein
VILDTNAVSAMADGDPALDSALIAAFAECNHGKTNRGSSRSIGIEPKR